MRLPLSRDGELNDVQPIYSRQTHFHEETVRTNVRWPNDRGGAHMFGVLRLASYRLGELAIHEVGHDGGTGRGRFEASSR